jgi:hypothetical protein
MKTGHGEMSEINVCMYLKSSLSLRRPRRVHVQTRSDIIVQTRTAADSLESVTWSRRCNERNSGTQSNFGTEEPEAPLHDGAIIEQYVPAKTHVQFLSPTANDRRRGFSVFMNYE